VRLIVDMMKNPDQRYSVDPGKALLAAKRRSWVTGAVLPPPWTHQHSDSLQPRKTAKPSDHCGNMKDSSEQKDAWTGDCSTMRLPGRASRASLVSLSFFVHLGE
jgi:hypothetical protein